MSRVSSEDIESTSMFDLNLNYVIVSVLVVLLILKFKSRHS